MERFSHIWRSPRQKKWLIAGALTVVLYLIVGFFVVPALIRWQLVKQLPPATHRAASVRQVKFNPLVLSLTVRDLSLTETNGQPFASLGELYANFQLSSLFRWAWTFDEITLREPRAQVVLNEDGTFNFANLSGPSTNRSAPPPESGGMPRLLIFDLVVTNGHVTFRDLSKKTPFRTVYEPIDFRLNRFTTRPNQESPYAVEAVSDSGHGLRWAGTLTAQPLGSSGTLQVKGMHLPRFSPYLEDITSASLADGFLDLAGGYYFQMRTNGTSLVVTNLAVDLTRFEIKDPKAANETVVALPAVRIRDGIFNLAGRQLRLGGIALEDPSFLIRRRADGALNLVALMAEQSIGTNAESVTQPAVPTTSDQVPWVLLAENCELTGGAVQFEDAMVEGPFRTLLKPIDVRIQRFSTATNAEAAVEVSIQTEANEKIRLNANGSVTRVRSTSTLTLSEIDLKKYQPYLAPFFKGTVGDGKLEVNLQGSQEFKGDALEASLTNSSVRVSELKIQSADGGETLITMPALALENVAANLAQKWLSVEAFRSSGTALSVHRETNGLINLQKLMVASTNSVPRTKDTEAGAEEPWQISVNEFNLSDWSVQFTDQQTPSAGRADFDQLALTLKGVQFPSNAPIVTAFSTRINGGGTVGVQGMVWPYSPAATAEVQVAGVELKGLQPWIEPKANLSIQNGLLATKGTVTFSADATNNLALRFTGGVSIQKLATAALEQEFLSWEELALDGIDFDLAPRSATLERLRLAGLKTSLIIDEGGRPNIRGLLPESPTNTPPSQPHAAAAPAAPAAAGEPFAFALAELRLENTALHFNDRSIEPACVFDVQQIDAVVKGLSTEPGSRAEVTLSGRVDEASPFGLNGTISPLAKDLSLDLSFTNANLQMTAFTPYMEKYAGYPLTKGRLSLALNYALQDQKLNAQNKVRIDQLVLGPRNESPEATKLPVKLAVALLKNNDGLIDLELPVEGSLADPQFSLGPVIVKVIANVIVKAAASPFKLLGALVGGGEELSTVNFAPGEAQVAEGEADKLNKLVQALERRPVLNLEVQGSFDPAIDRDALARSMVREQVKSMRMQELAEIGQTPETDTVQAEGPEYERLLRSLVVSTFGTNLTHAVQAAAERAAAATNAIQIATPVRGPGLFARVGSVFKAGKQRAATKLAHRAAKADAQLLEKNPELATMTAANMEALLAAQTEVPATDLQQLMQERAKAVQAYLLASGKVTAERLFLVAPKTPDATFKGQACVNLSLN